jgi:hypothetical protein
MTNQSADPTDWLAYLEAQPEFEPDLSIARAWRVDKAEIERLRNIITGCPVCSELERNIRPASSEPEARK